MADRIPRATLDEITLRPYRPADRAALREICRRTAFRSKGSAEFFEDDEVHADYWTRYYTDYRPQDCRVVERDGRVVGYFLGCSDHRHFLRIMALVIVPSCVVRILWRLALGRYGPRSQAYIRYMLLVAPWEAPPLDHRAYPAHYHCNLLPEVYGLQLYSRLTLDFLDLLETKGIRTLHGNVTELAEAGPYDRFVRAFLAWQQDQGVPRSPYVMSEVPTRLYQTVAGDIRPMVNRVWGGQTRDCRVFFEFLRDRYKL